MNFKEAYEELKKGNKVRRPTWEDTFYLFMDENGDIKCYRQECIHFIYDLSILSSNDWLIEEKGDKLFSFTDIIQYLLEGKKAKLKEWPDDCYIYAPNGVTELYMHRKSEVEFVPAFYCFSRKDWEIVK